MATRSGHRPETLKEHSQNEIEMKVFHPRVDAYETPGGPQQTLAQRNSDRDAYGGTPADRRDMSRMNKAQELRRSFRFLSIFGYSLILGNGWVIALISIVIPLTNGGTAGGIWMYLTVIAGMTFSTLSMAEMASMAPTAGGQYHWVSEFAPRRYQQLLSFLTGWLCALGWQTGLCGTAYSAALAVQGMIALNSSDYTVPSWQGVLLTIVIVLCAILFNTTFLRKLPMFEGFMLAIHIFGFCAVLVVMWVMGDKSPSKEVWTQFSDYSGWGSYGVATLVGSLGASGALLGSDSAAHLAEELKDAAWVLPRSMVATAVVNYTLTLVVVVTLMTVKGGDTDELLSTGYAQPYVQIFYNVTQSTSGATALTALIFVLLVFGIINQVTTTSRQLWSFARDQGLPFSTFLSQVRPGWNVPLNAVMITLAFSIVVSMIILGSPVAFFTLGSLCGAALYSSYLICIGCVAWRRITKQPLLPSRFDLGSCGLFVNLAAIAFLSVQFVFLFFPTAPYPTAPLFNWTIVVFGAVVIWALVYFQMWGRKGYQGPVAYVRKSA